MMSKMKNLHLASTPMDSKPSSPMSPSYPELSFSHDHEISMPSGPSEMTMKARLVSHDKPRSPGGKHRYTMQVTHLNVPVKAGAKQTAHDMVGKSLDKIAQRKLSANNNPPMSAPGKEPPVNNDGDADDM